MRERPSEIGVRRACSERSRARHDAVAELAASLVQQLCVDLARVGGWFGSARRRAGRSKESDANEPLRGIVANPPADPVIAAGGETGGELLRGPVVAAGADLCGDAEPEGAARDDIGEAKIAIGFCACEPVIVDVILVDLQSRAIHLDERAQRILREV